MCKIINKLSKETQEMLNDGYGFRNDTLYGSGVEEIQKIIEFETIELENTDIFETCEELYGIDYETIDLNNPESVKNAVKKTIKFIFEHFNAEVLYGKWLAPEKSIIQYYEGDEDISKYIIPDDAIIISDLGEQGALFVSAKGWRRYNEI